MGGPTKSAFRGSAIGATRALSTRPVEWSPNASASAHPPRARGRRTPTGLVPSGNRTYSVRPGPDTDAPSPSPAGIAAAQLLLDRRAVEVPSIKRLPPGDRPRERMLLSGCEALSDVELVALVLGGDLGCAHLVVSEVGDARSMRRAALGQLKGVRGVGEARACQLLAALELGRRASHPDGERGDPIRTPTVAAARLAQLVPLEQEELHVLALDSRHREIARFVAARGAQNVVYVSPRDVFRRLLREGAAGAIVAHNHPSGDPTPSADDVELTNRLRAAGDLVGVALIDHLVIARDGYHSFADQLRATRAV